MIHSIKRYFFILLATSLIGCAGPSIFPEIPLSTTSPTLSDPIFFAIDETTARGYLVNSNNTVEFADASLMVLDLTNPVAPVAIRAISLKNFSGQGFLDKTAKKLYLSNRLSDNGSDKTDQILKIDVDEASPGFLTVEEFASDDNPFGVASNGTNLFVVGEKSLGFYFLSDLTRHTRVDINFQTTSGSNVQTDNTREVALSPSGQFAFVTNRGDRMVILNTSEIPLPDPTLALTLGGAEAVDYVIANTISTRGIASDANFVYVVEGTPPALKVLKEESLAVVSGNPQQILISTLAAAEIPLGKNPNEVALDPLNHRAYVSITDEDEVAVIDTNLFIQVERIPVKDFLPPGIKPGEAPFALSAAVLGGTPYIYVLNLDTDNISIIDGNTLTVVGNYP